MTGDDSNGFVLTDTDSDYDPMSEQDDREDDSYFESDGTQSEPDDDKVMSDQSTIQSTSGSSTSRTRGRPKGSASSRQTAETEYTEQHWHHLLDEGTASHICVILKKEHQ